MNRKRTSKKISSRKFIFIALIVGIMSVLPTITATSSNDPPAADTQWWQQDPNVRTVTHDETGLLTFLGVDNGHTFQGFSAPNATLAPQDASAAIAAFGSAFGLTNPSQELQFARTTEIRGSGISYRFQQVYRGVPVLAGELAVNYNDQGILAAISGEISPNLSLSVTPTVAPSAAQRDAITYVARDFGTNISTLQASNPELWIYDPQLFTPFKTPPELVWRVEVTSTTYEPIRYMVLVDAKVAGISLAFNQVDTLWHDEAPALSAPHNASFDVIAGSGGGTPLPASGAAAPNFTADLSTHTANNSSAIPGAFLCDESKTALSGAASCTNGSTSEADRAHYFARNTFDYYDANHGRNSINNAGMQVVSTVLYTPDGIPFLNAFWNGQQMVYGNGGLLTTDDIVGHELTHGVTQFTSNLFYFYESGAINEAMSDIFGEFIDLSNGINSFGGADAGGDRWLAGEDSSLGAIRNMQNPPAFSDPDRTRSPFYFAGTGDGGGVHTNSGVANKAAYLITDGASFNGQDVTGLGITKASAIFYQTNLMLLTSGSDYNVLYEALYQACQNLVGQVGISASDCTEVREATLATEMNLTPVNDDFAPAAPVCAVGEEPQNLFYDSFESGTGNFTIGENQGGLGAGSWQETSSLIGDPYATTGTKSMWGLNNISQFGLPGQPLDSFMAMNSNVTLPANAYLHFSHYFAWETGHWDGGVLEYSTNGGASWVDAGGLFNAGQNYTGTLTTAGNNPIEGRQAFTTFTRGFVSSRYDLSSLAGSNIRFRWRIGADSIVTVDGWIVDDIRIYTCAPEIPLPPEGINLVTNGDFSSGLNNWTPAGDVVASVVSSQMRFYRDSGMGNGWGFIQQPFGYRANPSMPFEIMFDLGNNSPSARNVSVYLHNEGTWDNGALGCNFQVPGNPSMNPSMGGYTIRGTVPQTWSRIVIEISVLEPDTSTNYIFMDNVDVRYQPSLGDVPTTCLSPIPIGVNLVQNPNFNAFNFNNWAVAGDMIADASTSEMRFVRDPSVGNGWALLLQNLNVSVETGMRFTASLKLGNSTGDPRFVAVYLHDNGTWATALGCVFQVPPNAPLQTYTFQGNLPGNWTNATLEINPFDTGTPPDYTLMDDVDVQYMGGLDPIPTTCTSPVPIDTNLVQNPDFNAFNFNFWAVAGDMLADASTGQMRFVRDASLGNGWALLLQNLNQSVTTGMPFEVTLDLGNATTQPRFVTIYLHDNGSWATALGCVFEIPASAPLQSYSFQGMLPGNWGNITLEIGALDTDSPPNYILMDNVNVQYRPSLGSPPDTCTPSAPLVAGLEAPADEIRIEAEDANMVSAAGGWVVHDSDAASGSAYMYSGGESTDTLALNFTGAQITIVYVQHPALGSFDVFIDGEVVQTVSLAGVQNFGERALIADLPEGEHTLTIVPHEGVIAVDAFLIGSDGTASPEPAP